MFFSSESNSSSYPLFYNQSSIFTNTIPENNNILFHQQHFNNHNHGRYNNYIFQQPTNHHPSISENPIFKIPSINQENNNNNSNTLDYPSNLMMMSHMSSTRKTANKKKDRHTKICTAQGIRDRRVRLSMSIAREFFNLQDMLGYDKASKTLGWLLGKSKAAIDELASSSNNNIVTSGDDDLNEDDDDEKNGLNDDNSSSKKRKRGGEVSSFKDQNLGEEVRRREKARERARERTRKKKIIVDDDDDHNKHHQLENLDHHHQRGQKDSMICESSSAAAATLNSAPIFSKGVNVGETVVIKGTKSRSESSFGYNYETTISSKDDQGQENGIYYNDHFTKSASESCNYGGIMQSPGFLPALNIINLSTEIHINARPWDTYSNQNLH